jgi:hypothetical protein
MLVLNTSLKNYTAGAWIETPFWNKVYHKWRKLAIVTEKNEIKKFTDIFGKLIPPQTRDLKWKTRYGQDSGFQI